MEQKAETTQKRKVSVLWQRLALILLALVIGVQLYHWYSGSLRKDGLPMPMGVGMSIVLSGSMEPTLQVNDLVIVHRQDSYRTGDIVVFQTGSALVVHRIVSIDGDTVVTRGDANDGTDPPITTDAIKGRVAARIPGVGAAVQFLRTPFGIGAALIAAVVMAERSFRRERRADEQQTEQLKEEIRRLRAEQEQQNNQRTE